MLILNIWETIGSLFQPHICPLKIILVQSKYIKESYVHNTTGCDVKNVFIHSFINTHFMECKIWWLDAYFFCNYAFAWVSVKAIIELSRIRLAGPRSGLFDAQHAMDWVETSSGQNCRWVKFPLSGFTIYLDSLFLLLLFFYDEKQKRNGTKKAIFKI